MRSVKIIYIIDIVESDGKLVVLDGLCQSRVTKNTNALQSFLAFPKKLGPRFCGSGSIRTHIYTDAVVRKRWIYCLPCLVFLLYKNTRQFFTRQSSLL